MLYEQSLKTAILAGGRFHYSLIAGTYTSLMPLYQLLTIPTLNFLNGVSAVDSSLVLDC